MKLLPALKYLLAICLFFGTGCDKITSEKIVLDKSFVFGKEFSVHINQLYTSTDGQYTLQINEISDSRCPDGVECFWQGEVSLKCEWTVSKNARTIELHTVMKSMEQQPDGFNVQIVNVLPFPKNGIVIKPEDLVITLLINKK